MPTPEARKSRKRLQWIVTVCGVVASVALITAGAALKNSRDVGRTSRLQLCREEQKTRLVLHDLIRDVLKGTRKQPPSVQRAKTITFFKSYLDRLDRLNCGVISRTGP